MSSGWDDAVVQLARIVAWVVIGSGLMQTTIYLVEISIAAFAVLRRPPVDRPALLWARYGDVAPPIALIVPAYNEAANIVDSTRSLLSLEYPNFEVVVVNDGSRDDTLARLIAAFRLRRVERPFEELLPHKPVRAVYASPAVERLVVLDKENGGKADAQNAGVDLSRAPLVCAIDGDSILEPDALMRAAQPFIEDPDRTLAVGGTIRIANGARIEGGRVVTAGLPRRPLPLFQVVEYLRAFLMARLAWSQVNALMLISGAFGVFRRAELVAVGGFRVGSLGEDLDLIMKLHRHMIDAGRSYRIGFIPEPVCWTEAPENLRTLARQRSRWQRGALEAFFRYRSMLFRPRYGRVGTLGLGQMLIVDVVGPIAEVTGYLLIPALWALGLLSVEYLLAFMAIVFTYGVFVSVCSLVLAEAELRRFPKAVDLAVLTGAAVLENFGYRQLSNFWRVHGYWRYLRGDKSWGEMTRIGLARRGT